MLKTAISAIIIIIIIHMLPWYIIIYHFPKELLLISQV